MTSDLSCPNLPKCEPDLRSLPVLPSGWLKSLIPKSALSVEEEAWNAYPYTKTRFTCPFVEKFSIEVETYYYNDGGSQENVFNLSKSEMKQREVGKILPSTRWLLIILLAASVKKQTLKQRMLK